MVTQRFLLVGKEETDAFYDSTVKMIREAHPDFEGALTPEESVSAQLKTIQGMTIEDTGRFYNQNGKDEMY